MDVLPQTQSRKCRAFDAVGIINYTIWSDVFICPNCGEEFTYWNVAVDDTGNMRNEQHCPKCNATISKSKCERAKEMYYSKVTGTTTTFAKQVPVLINYQYGGKRYEKVPDENDLTLIEKIRCKSDNTYWFPEDPIPNGVKTADPIKLGITNVNLFYTSRNLYVLAALWEKASKTKYQNQIRFCITSVLIKTASKLHNIGLKNGNNLLEPCQMLFISKYVQRETHYPYKRQSERIFVCIHIFLND